MTLTLVGAGVAFDLTLGGLEALKTCDEAYLETYTNPIEKLTISGLEAVLGRPVKQLDRSKVESTHLLELAKTKEICLLVSGDPLTATTHISLVLEAKQKRIPVKIIHNSSIYAVAPGRSGLQAYRFGKTASLVNPRPNYKPTSSLGIISENLGRDLHTLVLLDTEPEPMDAKIALEMLSNVPGLDTAVVLSRIGYPDEKISYGKIEKLKMKKADLGKPPFTVIVPAKPHPVEQEFLELLQIKS